MKTHLTQQSFLSELVGWGWRGILCAAPSGVWAVIAAFTRPSQIAAMVLGVSCYILAFAVGSTWLSTHPTPARARFSRALKVAAAIKAATLVGAAGAWSVSAGKMAGWLIPLVLPDLYLGSAAMGLVGLLPRLRESAEIAQQNSFLLTGLITLLQGAFLTLLLALIALLVLGGQNVWRWMKRRKFLPAPV